MRRLPSIEEIERTASRGSYDFAQMEQILDAMDFLRSGGDLPYDIVFLDPPFAADTLGDLCRLLDKTSLVRSGSLVYLEDDRTRAPAELPEGWSLLKSKAAGNVRYSLAQVEGTD